MSAWARPGVKCVCVEGDWDQSLWASFRRWLTGTRIPAKNEICIIKHVGPHPTLKTGCYLWLHGFDRSIAFRADCFRPLITQQDDVSLFTHHLDGLPVGADA